MSSFFFFSAINQNNHSWREVVLLVNYFSKDAEGKHKNITFFFLKYGWGYVYTVTEEKRCYDTYDVFIYL